MRVPDRSLHSNEPLGLGPSPRSPLLASLAFGGLTLETYIWVEEFMDPDDVQTHQLYPQERSFTDLPTGVRNRYEAMLELQHVPDAFAVRAGRLLETVCADRGVHPKTDKNAELSQRLDQLVKQADVPRSLTDQAHLVRKYRNVGGHDMDGRWGTRTCR